MSDTAVERLLNLALYLADARQPVTAETIRAEVFGYPPSAEQDEAAFLRMFERDKEQLRAAGFLIDADERGRYLIDRSGTFAAPITLTADETAAVRTAAAAMLGDPSFPYPEDLRLALAKISTGIDTDAVPVAARLVDEDPARQGTTVAALTLAAAQGKRAHFEYTNSYGASAPHTVEPYGLFLHDGRWYLVGRDADRDEVRTYAVARLERLAVDKARPASRDFERPADFDVRRYVMLPFQYGAGELFEAVLRFEAPVGWRARSLSAGQGSLSEQPDGSVHWRVHARSAERLLRFALENGPGVEVVEPVDARVRVRTALAQVVAAHA